MYCNFSPCYACGSDRSLAEINQPLCSYKRIGKRSGGYFSTYDLWRGRGIGPLRFSQFSHHVGMNSSLHQRGQTQSAHFCRGKNTCSTPPAKMILDHQMSVSTFSRVGQESATLGHKHGPLAKPRPCKRQSLGRLGRVAFATRFMVTQKQAFSLKLCRNIEKKTWQAKKKIVLKFAKPRAPA